MFNMQAPGETGMAAQPVGKTPNLAIMRAFQNLGGGQQAGPAPVQVGQSDALQRRMGAIDNSPIRQIAESLNSLKNIPDQKMREDLAYPLMKADYMARNKKAGV